MKALTDFCINVASEYNHLCNLPTEMPTHIQKNDQST